MRPDVLGVIGLGAIGGSVALDAARSGIPRIIGFSVPPADGVAALKAHAITELANDPRQVVEAADLVVIAAPPAATLRLLHDLAPVLKARGVWCTDTASVKRSIAALAGRLGLTHFAGSHPFAGTHRTGFAAARAGRFAHATVYVCPAPSADDAAREIAHFWETVVAAEAVVMDAERHDQMLAWTSHLPQAAASALAGALAGSGLAGATFGSGARDTTRLAASAVEMWRDVLLLNRDALLRALDGMEDELGTLRRALVTGDARTLAAWLEQGAAWRRGLGE